MRTDLREGGADGAEIVPLNREAFDFDLAGATVEELERRLEMALAVPGAAGNCTGCPKLAACGTFCSPPPIAGAAGT